MPDCGWTTGSGAQTLITIDHVVRENHVLGTAWEKYKNLMPLVVAAPDAYGASACQLPRGCRATDARPPGAPAHRARSLVAR